MDKQELVRVCSQTSVYLMGLSFVFGSLFTVLMLLVLDFMRRNKAPEA